MMMITCLILWMPVSDARSGLADPVTFLGPVQAAKAHDASTAAIARHASQPRPFLVTMPGQRRHRAVCPGPDMPDQQAPQPPWWVPVSAFSLGERKPRLVERKVRSGSEKLMKTGFPGGARLADGPRCRAACRPGGQHPRP